MLVSGMHSCAPFSLSFWCLHSKRDIARLRLMSFFNISCTSNDLLGYKGFISFALYFSLLSVLATSFLCGSSWAVNYPFRGGILFGHLCWGSSSSCFMSSVIHILIVFPNCSGFLSLSKIDVIWKSLVKLVFLALVCVVFCCCF